MNDQLSRLMEVRFRSGLNQGDFAQSLGMSPTGFSTMIARDAKVSKTLAMACELAYGYRTDWILTGEGPERAAASAHLDTEALVKLELLEGDLDNNDAVLLARMVTEALRKFSESFYQLLLSRLDDYRDAALRSPEPAEQGALDLAETLEALMRERLNRSDAILREVFRLIRPYIRTAPDVATCLWLLTYLGESRWLELRDRSSSWKRLSAEQVRTVERASERLLLLRREFDGLWDGLGDGILPELPEVDVEALLHNARAKQGGAPW
jgi:hypothetical protein